MSDPEISRLGRRFARALDGAKHRTEMSGRTGKLATDTTVDPNPINGAATNKIWVRLGATQENPAGRGEVQVWNYGRVSTRKADLPVIVDFNRSGELRVVRADEQAADTYGVPPGFYTGDALPPELSDTLIPAKNITDLKPRLAEGGGMVLYIAPGWVCGHWWAGGDIALDDYQTVTALRKAWVVVALAVVMGTVVPVLMTTQNYSLATLIPPTAEFERVLALPLFADSVPIAAVPLSDTATTFTNNDISDLRGWDGVRLTSPRYLAAYNYKPSGSGAYKIGLGSSFDGCHITRAVEPLLDLGAGGTWDDTYLAWPCLVRGPNGVLHLYYAGHDGGQWSLGLARSFDDGRTWAKYASNPVLAPAGGFEATGGSNLGWPRVLYDEMETDSTRRWKMVYNAGLYGAGGIAYATSSDGLTWTRRTIAGNPVLPLSSMPGWGNVTANPGAFIRLGDTFYIFINGATSIVTPSYQSGLVVVDAADIEAAWTPNSTAILVGDGISSALTVSVSVGATSVTVTSTASFKIGMAVWVYDADNWYLSHVDAIPSTTTLILRDPAPAVVTTTGGTVRSIAYNSVNIVGALYDGGWRFSLSLFQPGFNSGSTMEASGWAWAKEAAEPKIDYQLGAAIPISLAESDDAQISFENPFILDTWDASARFHTESDSDGGVEGVTSTAPITVDNTDPLNPVIEHAASGVTPGTYTSVTVDDEGHVTAGTTSTGVSLAMLHEHVFNEDHTGATNSARTTFVTANEFAPESTVVVLNGTRLRLNTDYTEAATCDAVTFMVAPATGDDLILDYIAA